MVLVDGESTAVGYVTLTMLLPFVFTFQHSFSSGTFSRELGVT